MAGATLFRVLGRVEAYRGGHRLELGRRRERCLLAVLLLEARTVVPVERLLDLLWEDEPPPNARANLHSHVSRLRNRLEGNGVRFLARDGGYVAEVDPQTVDAHRFRGLVDIGRNTPDPADRFALLRQALELWRGPALADVASDRLRARVAGDLTELQLTATEIAVDAALALGRHEELLGELSALTAEHPLRERPAGQLMLALYRAGRQPDALAVYHRLRTRLASELGVDPTPELRDRHEAILRHDPGLDLDEPARPAPPTQLPPVTAHLTGRDAELAGLDEQAAVSVIHGMPGVGKTALALHWAHQAARRFPDGQLFVDLRGYAQEPPRSPTEVLAHFLVALGVPAERIPSTAAELSALYRTSLTGKRILIVLDNAASAAQVRPLLPGAAGCVAVVTCRDDLAGLVATNDANPIPLTVLTAGEAERLLVETLPPARVAEDPAAIHELARLCGHLPLALRIAAALLITHDEPVAGLVTRLRAGDRLRTLQVPGDPQAAVGAALELTYRTLDPPARCLFGRLSLAPGADFTPPVAAALLDLAPPDAAPVLHRLEQAHLVQEHRPGRYRMHDLVRDYAAERAAEGTGGERLAAVSRVLDWYLHTACEADLAFTPFRPRPGPGSDPPTTNPPLRFAGHDQALAWCTAEEANLVAAVDLAAEHGLDAMAWRIPASLGYFGIVRQGHPGLVDSFRVGRACAERGGDREGAAWMCYGMGIAMHQLRRFDEAIRQLREAVTLFQEAGMAWAAAFVYCSLGSAHRDLGRVDEAFEHFGRSSELFTKVGLRWGVGLNRHGEGDTYRRLGRFTEALACYHESAVIGEELGFHWGIGVSNAAVGDTLRLLGRPAEAVTHYERALDAMCAAGDQHGQAVALDLLGQAARDLGRPGDTVRHWTRAVALFEQLDDPRAATLRASLATVVTAMP